MSAHGVKQRLKNGIYSGVGAMMQLSGAGWASRRLDEWRRGPSLRVLMYHKVDAQPDNPPCVPPPLFAAQMEYLRAHYHPISAAEWLAARRGEAALPERAVLVTFDDGYRDNLIEAAPVLKRLGVPALIFLPTDFLGADRPLPHDEERARQGVQNPTLTWDEARHLLDYGFEIGSHGESHRIFSGLPPEVAAAEIRRSKALLEERIGRAVRCFAYVNGAPNTYDESTIEAVRTAGYEVAFATHMGPVFLDDAPYTLRRANVEPLPMYAFARLVAGDCDPVGWKDSPAGLRGKRVLDGLLGIRSR